MKKEAQQHLKEAFSQKILAPISYVNSAAIKLEDGDLKGALADADAAISKDKWLKEAYELRAQIKSKLGNGAGADIDNQMAKLLISHFDL